MCVPALVRAGKEAGETHTQQPLSNKGCHMSLATHTHTHFWTLSTMELMPEVVFMMVSTHRTHTCTHPTHTHPTQIHMQTHVHTHANARAHALTHTHKHAHSTHFWTLSTMELMPEVICMMVFRTASSSLLMTSYILGSGLGGRAPDSSISFCCVLQHTMCVCLCVCVNV